MDEETGCAWLDLVDIGVSLISAFLAVILGGMVMEEILMLVNLEGSLAATGHPPMYVALAGMMMVATLLGSWGALWIVNRLR